MLWVVFFHSLMLFNHPVLTYIKNIGYGGVDIFLFAAGLGNYHSYLKDHSPLEFIKRRIYRLAPVYVPFIIVWIVVKLRSHFIVYYQAIGNLFGVQGFSSVGGEFNWYLAGIFVCYLLTPYLASFIEKNRFVKNIALIGCLLLLSVAFWNDSRVIIWFTRLPIYTLGMLFSKYEQKVITKKFVLGTAVGFVIGNISLWAAFIYMPNYLWNYGLYWYPFILIVPFLCIAASLISA